MSSGWLSAAQKENEKTNSPSGANSIFLMTAEEAAIHIEKNGVQEKPELEEIALNSMMENIQKRRSDFEKGLLADGEHWVKTIDSPSEPNLGKMNQSLLIKRQS
jgi:hypothetical protein